MLLPGSTLADPKAAHSGVWCWTLHNLGHELPQKLTVVRK